MVCMYFCVSIIWWLQMAYEYSVEFIILWLKAVNKQKICRQIPFLTLNCDKLARLLPYTYILLQPGDGAGLSTQWD